MLKNNLKTLANVALFNLLTCYPFQNEFENVRYFKLLKYFTNLRFYNCQPVRQRISKEN